MVLLRLKVKEVISLLGVLCGVVIIVGIFFSDCLSGLPKSTALSSGNDSSGMNNFRAVFVTTPNIEVAKKIAHGLVSNRLAACVNIIPQITSVYEWEGKINEDSELLLMIKTESDRVDQIDKFVRENHPYDLPEVIAVPIDQGSTKYLQWIKDTLKGGEAKSSS